MTDEELLVDVPPSHDDNRPRTCWSRYISTSRVVALVLISTGLLFSLLSTRLDVHRILRGSSRSRLASKPKKANVLQTPTQRFFAGDRPSVKAFDFGTEKDDFRVHNYRAYSEACIRFESPLYGTGDNNGLAIISAVERKFTPSPTASSNNSDNVDSPEKWTMAAELNYGMAPNLHMYHPLQSLLSAVDFYVKHSSQFHAIVMPSDFLGADGHGNVTMSGFVKLYPFIKLIVVQPGKVSTLQKPRDHGKPRALATHETKPR